MLSRSLPAITTFLHPPAPPASMLSRSLRHPRLLRCFSTSIPHRQILPASSLPDRIKPEYNPTDLQNVYTLHWTSPPRNILLIHKPDPISEFAATEFTSHLQQHYPTLNILLEPATATVLSPSVSSPLYAFSPSSHTTLHAKTDLVVTLGGDGTLLHAAKLFSTTASVPPILSFAMGTRGFLGQFKWAENAAAFALAFHKPKVLRRARLMAGVYTASSTERVHFPNSEFAVAVQEAADFHALNEIVLHRGADPRMATLQVVINGREYPTCVADGLIIATPTGSTAYSLSCGGSIVHPGLEALMVTPMSPRNAIFRPLVLPGDAEVRVRLDGARGGSELQVDMDGIRWGVTGRGMEVRIRQEEGGGLMSVMREGEGNGYWIGGLKGVWK